MGSVNFFAYSHLMDVDRMTRLGIGFSKMIRCELPGYQLTFNVLYDEHFRFERLGIPNITPCHGSRVEGVLYEVNEEETPRLDLEAGVHKMKFYRKSVDVHTKEGSHRAITYIAWPDVTSFGLFPDEQCLNHLLYAAKKAGVTPAYQHWLETSFFYPAPCKRFRVA